MTWRRGCRQEYGFNVKFFYISDLQFPLIYDGNDRTYITGPLRWPGLTTWQGQCNGIGVQCTRGSAPGAKVLQQTPKISL